MARVSGRQFHTLTKRRQHGGRIEAALREPLPRDCHTDLQDCPTVIGIEDFERAGILIRPEPVTPARVQRFRIILSSMPRPDQAQRGSPVRTRNGRPKRIDHRPGTVEQPFDRQKPLVWSQTDVSTQFQFSPFLERDFRPVTARRRKGMITNDPMRKTPASSVGSAAIQIASLKARGLGAFDAMFAPGQERSRNDVLRVIIRREIGARRWPRCSRVLAVNFVHGGLSSCFLRQPPRPADAVAQ